MHLRTYDGFSIIVWCYFSCAPSALILNFCILQYIIHLSLAHPHLGVFIIKCMSSSGAIINNMKQSVKLIMQNWLTTLYHYRFEVCIVSSIISAIYLLFSLFEVHVLIAFAILITSIFGLVLFKWRSVRQNGLISLCTPQLREVLLKRSIFDIYRDQVYYPYFTKIIEAFVKGAISKPHPDKLNQIFEDLPEKAKNAIFTKGILHLAPEKVEKLILEKQPELLQLEIAAEVKPAKGNELVPATYGMISNKWDRQQEYQAQQVKIHEHTISKEILLRLNQKIRWIHIIPLGGLLAAAIMKTKGKKFGKLLLYNGSFLGIILLLSLIAIKYQKPTTPRNKKPSRSS